MTMLIRFVPALVAAIAVSGCASSDRVADDASGGARLSAHTKPDPIQHLSFVSGTWRGEMDGEFVEEVWSTPRGGAMMGAFRWLNAEGRPRMYEILTISKEGEDILLRMRHFNAAMIAWEEKDAPVTMRLAEFETGRAVFVNESADQALARIVFRQEHARQLAIDVEFREGQREPLNFEFISARP